MFFKSIEGSIKQSYYELSFQLGSVHFDPVVGFVSVFSDQKLEKDSGLVVLPFLSFVDLNDVELALAEVVKVLDSLHVLFDNAFVELGDLDFFIVSFLSVFQYEILTSLH